MRIKRIEIKGWIGLHEFTLEPGKINVLSGRVGAGKSSVIDALEKAFANKSRRAEVIRHGEDGASLFIQADDGLEVERRIRHGKSDYLRVRKPGEVVPQTEAFLRKFINGEIFRPLEFVAKSPDEQTLIILNMLEIPWTKADIQAWFGEIPSDINYDLHILQVLKQIENGYYERREVINREIRVLEAQVAGIKNDLPPNYDGEHWLAQSIQQLYTAVAQAEETNRRIATARSLIDNLESRIAAIMFSAETAKANRRGELERKRSELREFKVHVGNKIEKANAVLAGVDDRIGQAQALIDVECELEIQEIRRKHASRKELVAAEIRDNADAVRRDVSGYESSLAVKDQELLGIDELETQSIAAIDRDAVQQVEIENAKAGNARVVLEQEQEIDVAPLSEKADWTAKMQGHLHEWIRMRNIIKDKLSPRQEASATLTAKIEKARGLPKDLLKLATVPIPEITVDGNGQIRIGETLIDGLSEGEQWKLAFQVAKAQAGELKLVCLDGLNKLNPSEREQIMAEIKDDEYQYFVCETTDGDLEATII